MTDNSRKTPPAGLPIAPRRGARSQSHDDREDDRDVESYAARKEREARAIIPAEFASEEVTGKYEGSELDMHRDRRTTPDRIRRLERKHDELKGDLKDVRAEVKDLSGHVSDLREDVAGAVGKLDGQEKFLSSQQKLMTETLSIVKKSAEREHVTFTAMVEVDKEKELAKVEVDKEKELAKVEVDKEEKVDTVKARSDRRKRNLKILGLVASGGGIIELLHRLGVL